MKAALQRQSQLRRRCAAAAKLAEELAEELAS
jgi:hypothetical protein